MMDKAYLLLIVYILGILVGISSCFYYQYYPFERNEINITLDDKQFERNNINITLTDKQLIRFKKIVKKLKDMGINLNITYKE
jgi:hypothetical protein